MAAFSPAESIMTALASKIAASAFYTSIGQRIAVDRIAADLVLPCCVYSMQKFDAQNYMGGSIRYEGLVDFTIYDSCKTGTAALHSLATSLYTGLGGSYTVSNLDRMTVTRVSTGTPSFEDEAWSIIERYRVVSFKV